MRGRLALGAVGVLMGLYGAGLALSRLDGVDLLDVGLWLAGGVVVHDVLLAPLVLLLALGTRQLPLAYRRAGTVALVVVGSLTLLAVPVLLRLGARPDNPTLLDRPYLVSWLVLVGATAVAVAVVGWRERRGDRTS